MLYENESVFAGKPVRDYDPSKGIETPTEVVYRLRVDWDEYDSGVKLTDRLTQFLDDPASSQVSALIIGIWEGQFECTENGSPVVAALAEARERLPNLRALFFGDIQQEESEISWIMQTDVSPLLEAFPELEVFGVRGNEGLSLGVLRHDRLKELAIETGGLSGKVVREVAAAQLPELEHLELWLGTDEYGGDATLDDLAPILSGKQFPRLRYLGLRDSTMADEVAEAIAATDVLERIETLDLSLGTLTDRGALALINAPGIGQLKLLDLHHHYISEDVTAKLQSLGIAVNTDDRQNEDTYNGEIYRYNAVSE